MGVHAFPYGLEGGIICIACASAAAASWGTRYIWHTRYPTVLPFPFLWQTFVIIFITIPIYLDTVVLLLSNICRSALKVRVWLQFKYVSWFPGAWIRCVSDEWLGSRYQE